MKLSSAKAVVTGGASGLGLATAERIMAAGGHVVLLDVNDELGKRRRRTARTRNARYVNTDVASEDSVKAAIETCDLFHGRRLRSP